MLPTLSDQEKLVVALYDRLVKDGETDDNELWADGFTSYSFYGHPDGPVVDIGCGLGRALGILSDYGIRSYFGVDPSTESIAFCREHFPEYQFAVSEVRLLGETYPQTFSGFLFLNVLMYTPPEDLDTILKSISDSLLPGAPGLILVPNAREGVSQVVVEDGIIINFYDMEAVETALEKHGFVITGLRNDGWSSLVLVEKTPRS